MQMQQLKHSETTFHTLLSPI